MRVVVARTEPHQSRFSICQAAGESEGLEAGVGVVDRASELAEVEPFRDGAIGDVDDEARGAEVVGDHPVGGFGFDEVLACRSARPMLIICMRKVCVGRFAAAGENGH